MKITVLTFSLVFFLIPVFSQQYDHVVYKQDFELVYETAIQSEQYKKALQYWDELNHKYQDSLHTEEHILRAYCFYQLGRKNKAAKCMREAWCHQICDPSYFHQIQSFKWKPMVLSFNSRQQKILQQGYKVNTSLNSKDYDSLSYLIEKLVNIDQTYRSFISEEDRMKHMDSLRILSIQRDSLDMLEFLRIYDKYGYPGEKVSCYFSMRWLTFLLHTADYEWFYKKMYPLFEQDVRTGSMPASLFLFWIDRHSASNDQRAEYAVYQNPNHFKATPEELEEIKRKRFEMGVSKLFRIPYVLSSSN